MLTVLLEAELDRYIDRMYELALIPACTGYPVWYDGYKTKDMFIERTRKAFARENEEILLLPWRANSAAGYNTTSCPRTAISVRSPWAQAAA
jgi:hypothetical protein